MPVWVQPLWIVAAGAAGVVAIVAALYFLLSLAFPKIAAIAWATGKEATSQPFFWVLAAIGIVALILFPFIPYNTFGDDVKVVKDNGLTLILVLGILLALWTASKSIAEEIEGRTAMTVLSKPITRRQFILGKFLGIVAPVALMFALLGTVFLSTVSYKVVFDAHEAAAEPAEPQDCQESMLQVVPGLVLAFFEAAVLASISVAISTRLPIMANLLICSTVYVLGHLVPLLVQSRLGDFGIVQFFGRLLAVILPVLDHFNIQAAIATGNEVPPIYLAWTALYGALYCFAMLLVALVLFEDRDLA